MAPPTLIFGAGFLGVSFATPSELQELLNLLHKHDIKRIDTARRYPAVKPGQSEQLLGEVEAAGQGFIIDTKIKVVGSDASGSLTTSKIKDSVAESLEVLQVGELNVLHCHMPDIQTPIEETAKAFDEVYKQGKFKTLGLANYTVEQIEKWMSICNEKGYVRPSVYQGQYNLLCRRCEEDVMAVLRKHGMAYNAYSPLAGGFLTGKVTAGNGAGTRFEAGNRMGAAHSNWYDKPVMHGAVTALQDYIKPLGLTLTEVSMRWLVFHSQLGKGDGVIIGGSRVGQIEGNLSDVRKGRLEDGVVGMVEEVWGMVRGEAP